MQGSKKVHHNPAFKVQPWQMHQRQNMPLDLKIGFSKKRIRAWYEHWRSQVFVAFSGGKDSTALLHLVRQLYPEVPALFVNTGLEYPEIVRFVKTIPNVTLSRPKMTFRQVLNHHGYPVISKQVACALRRMQSPGTSQAHRNKTLYGDERGTAGKLPERYRYLIDAPFKISDRCCEVIKKRPAHAYQKATGRQGIVGTMAGDSNWRRKDYLKHGCNALGKLHPTSMPLSFWSDSDIWAYIRQEKLPYCKIYNTGVRHTGCMFCCFGVHLEESPNRFQLMKRTHPKLYDYCINKLNLRQVLDFIGVPYE